MRLKNSWYTAAPALVFPSAVFVYTKPIFGGAPLIITYDISANISVAGSAFVKYTFLDIPLVSSTPSDMDVTSVQLVDDDAATTLLRSVSESVDMYTFSVLPEPSVGAHAKGLDRISRAQVIEAFWAVTSTAFSAAVDDSVVCRRKHWTSNESRRLPPCADTGAQRTSSSSSSTGVTDGCVLMPLQRFITSCGDCHMSEREVERGGE